MYLAFPLLVNAKRTGYLLAITLEKNKYGPKGSILMLRTERGGGVCVVPPNFVFVHKLLAFSPYFTAYFFSLAAAASSTIATTSACFCKALAGQAGVTGPSIIAATAAALAAPKASRIIFLDFKIVPIPIE